MQHTCYVTHIMYNENHEILFITFVSLHDYSECWLMYEINFTGSDFILQCNICLHLIEPRDTSWCYLLGSSFFLCAF